jgi:DnaA N-terminal domain
MSRQAIAAVLARDDLASGERLVALSLASFADRENRAWPGAPAAAARAGLRRSRYLDAREQLVARGLVVVDQRATGRGRSSTVSLAFADAGPWWDGEINVELFEAVLGYSSARGPARLLLATMAAVADADGAVRDLSTEQLCAAGGVADRTYRRARMSLLESGDLVLVSGAGGRGNTNVWTVPDPRSTDGTEARRAPRRVAPPTGARPLVAAVERPDAVASAVEPASTATTEGGHDRTLTRENRPILTGVSKAKGGHDRTVPAQNRPVLTGVSKAKGGQGRTLFELPPLETPAERAAETPAETPAPNSRAGKEPQNPRTTEDPPGPPAGGSPRDSIIVEQTYVTDRGRTRRRTVRIDLAEVRRRLGLPTPDDRDDWERIRLQLADVVGESTFAIWLEPLELIAIDGGKALVVAAPSQTASWVHERFGRLMARCALRAGRELRLADEPEQVALGHTEGHPAASARGA